MLQGNLPQKLKELHDRYGKIVRIAPDELCFVDPEAWKDIYTRRLFLRPKQWGRRPPGVQAHNLISAPLTDHTRFRKALAPAFSENAVKIQEPTVIRYTNTLINSLHRMIQQDSSKETVVVDMVSWLAFTTFDIVGDLGWGVSFDCLQDQKYHPWTVVAMQYKALLYFVAIRYYPILPAVIAWLTPKSAMAGLDLIRSFGANNVKARLAREVDDRDFMSYMMAHNMTNPSSLISEEEMATNSANLIIGGSEPVATTLAAALNLLLRNPESKDRLVDEIRRSFQSQEHISAASTKSLPFLSAVLQETLRLSPPTPDSMRRAVPEGGVRVAGNDVPQGTTVGVSCYAAFRFEQNFSTPDAFKPERWLGLEDNASSPYAKDKRGVFHPFSVGPRHCPGQLLAWVEMRVILARLLWNFNIEIPQGFILPEWSSQKIYWAWTKTPMYVRLHKR